MIQIDRGRADEAGAPIQPDGDWFDDAREATDKALLEREEHQVDRGVYRHQKACAALEKLFHDKCAYCETHVTGGSEWDVEHYRPKAAVAERPDHPGYYWLAYQWSNLYPSCKFCNQGRKDPPRWGDQRWGATRGKADQFPLMDEEARAMTPEDPVAPERPLLLDPCRDQPEDYLSFTVLGEPISLEDNLRGAASIEILHLARKRLRDLRRTKAQEAMEVLRFIAKHRASGNEEARRDFEQLLDRMAKDESEYAAVVRAVRRDPDAFGV